MTADINKRVEQFVKLRDKIKELDDEHKNKMAPYREALDQLNSVLLQHLNSIGADSVKAQSGTVYRTAKKSATLADKSAFWSHVVVTGDFELLDWKANVSAVTDYAEKNGQLPPGVNLNVSHVVGVRRA